MTETDLKALRDRAWLSLNPSTAGAAKMTIGQLEQFAIGRFEPSPVQLRQLQIQLDQWEERP